MKKPCGESHARHAFISKKSKYTYIKVENRIKGTKITCMGILVFWNSAIVIHRSASRQQLYTCLWRKVLCERGWRTFYGMWYLGIVKDVIYYFSINKMMFSIRRLVFCSIFKKFPLRFRCSWKSTFVKLQCIALVSLIYIPVNDIKSNFWRL